MIIEVTDDDRGVIVRDAEDFKRLHVEYRLPADHANRVLGDSPMCAGVDGVNARIFADVLRQVAGSASDPSWQEDFDAMLGYAAGKGWYDPDARIIGVHIVTLDKHGVSS